MRPRKITDERIPRLLEVARVRLKAQEILATVPVNKQLAYEMGITPDYLHNIMHRLTTIMRLDPRAPYETLRRSIFNDTEYAKTIEKLSARKVKAITY